MANEIKLKMSLGIFVLNILDSMVLFNKVSSFASLLFKMTFFLFRAATSRKMSEAQQSIILEHVL